MSALLTRRLLLALLTTLVVVVEVAVVAVVVVVVVVVESLGNGVFLEVCLNSLGSALLTLFVASTSFDPVSHCRSRYSQISSLPVCQSVNHKIKHIRGSFSLTFKTHYLSFSHTYTHYVPLQSSFVFVSVIFQSKTNNETLCTFSA